MKPLIKRPSEIGSVVGRCNVDIVRKGPGLESAAKLERSDDRIEATRTELSTIAKICGRSI